MKTRGKGGAVAAVVVVAAAALGACSDEPGDAETQACAEFVEADTRFMEAVDEGRGVQATLDTLPADLDRAAGMAADDALSESLADAAEYARGIRDAEVNAQMYDLSRQVVSERCAELGVDVELVG